MTLLSIDPSTTKTGLAIFRDGNYLTHYLIEPEKANYYKGNKKTKEYKAFLHQRTANRVEYMITHLQTYFLHYQPDAIMIEDSYSAKDPNAVKMLGRIQGAVLGYTLSEDIPFIIKSPTTWRTEIGIPIRNENGFPLKRDDFKQLSIKYVKDKLNLSVTDDEADAICLGFSYFF